MGFNKSDAEDIERFRMHLIENERSENTIRCYMDTLKIFFGEYDELSKENLLKFKKEQVEKRKPATAANRIVALNQYCKFLNHQELTLRKVKIQRQTALENVITIEECKQILEGLKKDGDEKGYWIVKYLAKTGARVSEFIRLTKAGLDKGYCEMWTKGKIRRIYIPRSLIEESGSYFERQEGELLFRNRYGGQFSTRGIAQLLIDYGERYGIRREVMQPHSFRHLYAIEFLKKNKNVALLADLMGHSSVQTTSIYLRLSKDEQMRQFNEALDW